MSKKKETLVLENGKYDIEKIYDLHKNKKLTLSAIEFKYGIHRNELLLLLSEYEEKYKNEAFYTEVQRGDVVETTYIYDYNTYSITGEVLKKNLNSLILYWIDGDELPEELLNKVAIHKDSARIIKKCEKNQ